MRISLLVLFNVAVLAISLHGQTINPKQILEAPGRDYVLLSTDTQNSSWPIDGIYVPVRLKDSIYIKADSVCIGIIDDGRPDKCAKLPAIGGGGGDSATVIININGDTLLAVQDTFDLRTFDFDHESIIWWDDSLQSPFFNEDASDFKWRDSVLYIDNAGIDLDFGENIFITNNLKYSAVTGLYNTVVGKYAGISLTSGSYNNLMGAFAGDVITTGSSNTTLGASALGSLRSGDDNIAIGRNALFLTDSSSYNTAIGRNAGQNLTRGTYNVLLGQSAGISADSIFNSTFIGAFSGDSRPGDGNTFIGYLTGAYGSGDHNTVLGSQAGYDNEGNRNVYLGLQAGYDVVGDGNIMIGSYVGKSIAISDSMLVLDVGDLAEPFFYGFMNLDSFILNAHLQVRDIDLIDTMKGFVMIDTNNVIKYQIFDSIRTLIDTDSQSLSLITDGQLDTISITRGNSIVLNDSVRNWNLDEQRVVFWQDGDYRTDRDYPYNLGMWYDSTSNALVLQRPVEFNAGGPARLSTQGAVYIGPQGGSEQASLFMGAGFTNGTTLFDDTLYWEIESTPTRLQIFETEDSQPIATQVWQLDSTGQLRWPEYAAPSSDPVNFKFPAVSPNIVGIIGFDKTGYLVQVSLDSIGGMNGGNSLSDDDFYQIGNSTSPTQIDQAMWTGSDSSKIVRIGTNQLLTPANVLINGKVQIFETVGNNEAFTGESSEPVNYWRQRQRQTGYAWDRVQQDDIWYIQGSNLNTFQGGPYLSMQLGWNSDTPIMAIQSDGDIRFEGNYSSSRNDPLAQGVPVTNVFYTGPLGQLLVAPLDSLTARQGTPRFYASDDSTLIVTDHFGVPLDTVIVLGSNQNDAPDTDIDSMKIKKGAIDSLLIYEDDVVLAVGLQDYMEQTIRQINDTAFIITWPGTNIGKDTVCFLTNRIYVQNDTLFVNDSIIVFTDYRDSVQSQVYLSNDTLFVFDDFLKITGDSMGVVLPSDFILLADGVTRGPDTSLFVFEQSTHQLGIGTASPDYGVHVVRSDGDPDFAMMMLEDNRAGGAAQYRLKAAAQNRRIVSLNGSNIVTGQVLFQDSLLQFNTQDQIVLGVYNNGFIRFFNYGTGNHNGGSPSYGLTVDASGYVRTQTWEQLETLMGGPFQPEGNYLTTGSADLYQRWTYAVNGSSIGDVYSANSAYPTTEGIDFASGDRINISTGSVGGGFPPAPGTFYTDISGPQRLKRITINHATGGPGANTYGNTPNTYISTITLDAYGHITGITGGTDQNTTYGVFNGSTAGLVPGTSGNNSNLFLNGAGGWTTPAGGSSEWTEVTTPVGDRRLYYSGYDVVVGSSSAAYADNTYDQTLNVVGSLGSVGIISTSSTGTSQINFKNPNMGTTVSGNDFNYTGRIASSRSGTDGNIFMYYYLGTSSRIVASGVNGTSSFLSGGSGNYNTVQIGNQSFSADFLHVLSDGNGVWLGHEDGLAYDGGSFISIDNSALHFDDGTNNDVYLRANHNDGATDLYLQAANNIVIGADVTQHSTSGGYVWISGRAPTTGHTPVRIQTETASSNPNVVVRIGGPVDVNGQIITGSDRRLKHDIHSLDGEKAINELMQWEVVNFRYNQYPDEVHAGFIAQDIREISPQFVQGDTTKGMLSLPYDEMSVYAIKALQEAFKEIEKLKAEVDELKKR